jgi:hypothetical protein
MVPVLLESGIIIYGIIQVLVAFIAVVLAVKWNKYEFLAGLSFLLLYAIIEMIEMFFFTIVHGVFLDVAQFGFILLAIIFFIIGMHPSYPSWSHMLVSGKKNAVTGKKSQKSDSILTHLRKL